MYDRFYYYYYFKIKYLPVEGIFICDSNLYISVTFLKISKLTLGLIKVKICLKLGLLTSDANSISNKIY
jgi:hypothetical protein